MKRQNNILWLFATLLCVPVCFATSISSVTPNFGPENGGTPVIIRGFGLSGTTGVSFGGVPGAAFLLISDNKISVVSPRAANTGPVAIILAGAIPVSTGPNGFSYIDSGLGVAVGAMIVGSRSGPAPIIVATLPPDGSTVGIDPPQFSFVFSIDMDTTRTDLSKAILPLGLSVTQLVWADARTLNVLYSGELPTFGAKRVGLVDGYFVSTGNMPLPVCSGMAFNYEDSPPVIAGEPSMTPNPATTSDMVAFSVNATDPDGDALSFTWNFGDNMVGSGPSVMHQYANPGTYLVFVQVADGRGGIAKTPLNLVVLPAPNPPPEHGAPLPGNLIVTQARISLNFASPNGKQLGRDNINIKAVLELPKNFISAGSLVTVNIGAVGANFTLGKNNSAKAGKNTFRLTEKLVKKIFMGGAVKIHFVLSGSFANALAASGMTNATTSKLGIPVSLPVSVIFGDGTLYSTQVNLIWIARTNKNGYASWATAVNFSHPYP